MLTKKLGKVVSEENLEKVSGGVGGFTPPPYISSLSPEENTKIVMNAFENWLKEYIDSQIII